MQIEDLYIKARELIKNSKKPIVLFDSDPDGSTSFLQLKKTFKNIKFGLPIGNDLDSQKDAINQIEDKNDLLIIFDKSFICDEIIDEFKGRKILWVDHHIPLNEKQIKEHGEILFVNPLLFDKNDTRPTSYLTYKICENKNNLFLASLGSCSDFFILEVLVELHEYDKKLFDLLFKLKDSEKKKLFKFITGNKFNDEKTKIEREDWIKYLWYDTGFIKFKNFFDFLYKICKTERAIKTLNKISKMSELELSIELDESKDEIFERFLNIQKEYKVVFSKVKYDKESELVFISHDNTSVSFNRQISEELAYRLGNNWKVIFSSFFKDDKPFVSCSFRGNNYDVEKLIVNSLKGLNGRGGGHAFAAGASVVKEDFEEFKTKIFKAFEK